MMTCQHCQAQTNDGAVFCERCGHEVIPARQRLTPLAAPSALSGKTPLPPPSTPGISSAASPGRVAAKLATIGGPSAASTGAVVIVLRLPNGRRFVLKGKQEYIVGRLSADHAQPDVDLADSYGFEAGVSREHIKISVSPDGVFVEDLESANETVQNGYRLLPQQKYPLHHGDELRLAAITLYVSFERP
ncbi:MAG TPA: FHA domain-containing protein [Ktedonobacterales bacterium]|jgi:pSer/pThr/pTyr-binding forkhead associated (FHA) protein|nr:FHA domain-containing protein [Ktedonobacterales bacterium]